MKKSKRTLLGIFFGVLCLFASTAAGLGLIHGCDLLYRIDVKLLDLESKTGYAYDVILQNYRAVMSYLSPFNRAEFSLPDIEYSSDGARHFADCRPLFNGVYILGAISLVLIVLILIKVKKKDFLGVSAAATLSVPALVLLAVSIDFNSVFILFHKIFFNNQLWYFDPETDPIILILPEDFFMHCAVVIALCWLVAAAAQFFFHKRGRRYLKRI